MDGDGDLKFGTKADHSKSQPTHDVTWPI